MAAVVGPPNAWGLNLASRGCGKSGAGVCARYIIMSPLFDFGSIMIQHNYAIQNDREKPLFATTLPRSHTNNCMLLQMGMHSVYVKAKIIPLK